MFGLVTQGGDWGYIASIFSVLGRSHLSEHLIFYRLRARLHGYMAKSTAKPGIQTCHCMYALKLALNLILN
jgi:hypothetical protein